LDGTVHRLALDASTEPELDAGQCGEALREQRVVARDLGQLQRPACVVLGRGGTDGELEDVGDARVQRGAEGQVVTRVVERLTEARQRAIGVDRALEHVPEPQENLGPARTARRLEQRPLQELTGRTKVSDALLTRRSFDEARPALRTLLRARA